MTLTWYFTVGPPMREPWPYRPMRATGRDRSMDTERDTRVIDTDEDHIVRGLD
ncbi:hypothetical protein GCM10023201_23260 [Actinomycetospora corticicola]